MAANLACKPWHPIEIGKLTPAITVLSLGLLLIAAKWQGAFDTGENPREWDNTQLAAYIYAEVNPSVFRWESGDTITICQQSTSTCMLAAYVNPMSSAAWTKTRDVESRDEPVDPSLWEDFVDWIYDWFSVISIIDEVMMASFLWDIGAVPYGTVSIGPLVPLGEDDCSGCHW